MLTGFFPMVLGKMMYCLHVFSSSVEQHSLNLLWYVLPCRCCSVLRDAAFFCSDSCFQVGIFWAVEVIVHSLCSMKTMRVVLPLFLFQIPQSDGQLKSLHVTCSWVASFRAMQGKWLGSLPALQTQMKQIEERGCMLWFGTRFPCRRLFCCCMWHWCCHFVKHFCPLKKNFLKNILSLACEKEYCL